MATMISRGKELIRICPSDSSKLEYSTDSGHNWFTRFNGNSNVGQFSDLLENGKEILGTTSKGLFYATDGGHNWFLRKR
ncbi:hypothetical protein NG821_09090 [Prevotella cerevisiae]|uniref:Uncharacterized protein n=1 Tax=Segatella cerevisiae TaxID=2053716 RepID=A0ABT1BYU7_9BACT|nr:hypothetical protein [Segatella cerevisiae]MCO6025990.1 hypothetical protein [Segatella cerevisiae]